MSKKIEPWVDITCGKCGSLAINSGYYHRGIISALRKETKNWIYHEVWGNLCPDCQKQLEEDE